MRLKELLKRHKITQTRLANCIYKPNGTTYSVASINKIVNNNDYPIMQSATDVNNQIQEAFANMGIHEEIDFECTKELKQNTNKNEIDNTINEDLIEMQALTNKAKKLFNLTKSPFIDDVQERKDVFLSDEQRYIRQTMRQSASHAGFAAIIGESGAGKTTLKRDLIEGINQEQEAIIVIQPQTIDKTRLSAAHICDAIIADVSQDNVNPKRSMEAKARQIKQLLTDSSRAGNKHCLITDEAHDLSIPVLKYLKRFWELEDGMKRLLSIVLIGQPELKIKLNERNADVREVARRCEQIELQPLNADTEQYLTLKLKRIGKQFNDVFESDAIAGLTQRLTQKSGNKTISLMYPLIVNNTITCAMNEAAKLGQDKITADLFEVI